MKVTILSAGDGVVMQLGMIHAVISPTMSAIAGWEFVDSAWLKDDNIKAAGVWEVEMIKDRQKNPCVPFEPTQGMLDGVLFGVEMWKCLWEKLRLTAGDGSDDSIVRIDDLLETMEEAISVLDVPQAADTEKSKSKNSISKASVVVPERHVAASALARDEDEVEELEGGEGEEEEYEAEEDNVRRGGSLQSRKRTGEHMIGNFEVERKRKGPRKVPRPDYMEKPPSTDEF